ncbi:hypothetical protein GLOTRDRAFT_32965 [Gloeophyllum trabeum ATCC 11539]|uniref:F-box domain-containing protein n=1 Tax=Gloeophyllum trabeum (strain ATCC 11539 / FP-39264 / Madison 617) TaxID=670483 RepID=S7QIK0_GLOTA|nr:uncharacterized protein GLOTRDRAFT_32965 [Gloeophyllum trabeum ATCC 11539]EPQ59108.1 hypothetical protein GLOTRDRAFT_32965 [Gloeophyllum trabeum ATCC 11539]
MSSATFESLPVELIAEILSELDLQSLVTASYLSRRLNQIVSDPSLNPWRRPISRNLQSGEYEDCLKHLSVRSVVPRQNWVEIFSLARSSYLLFESTSPNLRSEEWEECFKRRFLPSWVKWKKDCSWREAYQRLLYRVWHRCQTSCTADEAWTKYIILNRNGTANELESSSRSYNPLAVFNEIKLQSNLAHLETSVRLVVQFADVRILALGVLHKPKGFFSLNPNAKAFLHPPGIEKTYLVDGSSENSLGSEACSYEDQSSKPAMSFLCLALIHSSRQLCSRYWPLTYPVPAPSHANYPFYTPGGRDKRWIGSGPLEEGGLEWVGRLMLTAQLLGPMTDIHADGPPFQDMDLVVGPGRGQYASFTWADLAAIAPWMNERITKRITGPGLGN